MKSKKEKDKLDNTLHYIFIKPWPYWVGGILIAISNIIYIWITKKPWGITKGLVRTGAWFLKLLGFDISNWSAWNYYDYINPLQDMVTWSNIGIVIGAFIAILMAGKFKVKKLKNYKQLFIAIIGGYLMGYGARIASGCNIGGLYSAISSLGINGWLFLPFVVFGIYIGNLVIRKFFV
ncbi:MAG: YeeE/YedE thiosulfate transporter family protein [Halanaerobiales bacterium]|nr:YeeE/YedE thiosulfate transporter family protein [Halanaerobiales bacterium]